LVNDYNLLRSVLDMNNKDERKIAEILSDMQREEIDAKNPDGSTEEEKYTPENTDGPPPSPPDKSDGPENPPGRDEVCARFFLSVNEKDKIPEGRMKRTNVFDVAQWELSQGKMQVSYTKSKNHKIPEQVDGERKGYFYRATVNIKGNEMISIPTIVYGDWISSYSTTPEVKVDFYTNDLGERFVKSPVDIILTYIVGIDKPISAVMKHGPGSPTAIKGISLSKLKSEPEYEEKMGIIDSDIKELCKDFLDNDPNPPPQSSDYGTWVKNYWKWFAFNEDSSGKRHDPCAYQYDEEANRKLDDGDNTFNAMKLRMGACRHKASGFFCLATYAGVPCHYVTNDCHAFVEVWVPGIGWNMYDLGGCSPPGQDPDDQPLDPDKKWEEPPDSAQDPPPKPDDPEVNESDLLTKQINAIATKAQKEGVGCDIASLIKGLWEDVRVNKKGRFF